MRRLSPAGTVDPLEVIAAEPRPAPVDRPWIVVNMVASVDGATAIDGVSGGLGGPGDRAVFGALRAVADVVVAAAGTVRTENYGPPTVDAEVAARRAERGQRRAPRLAIVTASVDLDPEMRCFSDPAAPPLVFVPPDAHERSATRISALEGRAEIIPAGTEPGSVDLPAMFRSLRSSASVALVEGGPSLNGQLLDEGLVDEWCLTVSPMLVSGDSRRIAHGPSGPPLGLELRRVFEADGALFLGYRTATDAAVPGER